MKPQKTLLAIMVGVYLLGFGMLASLVLDRMRFDGQRTAVLTRYEQALRRMEDVPDGPREGCSVDPGVPGECLPATPRPLNLPLSAGHLRIDAQDGDNES